MDLNGAFDPALVAQLKGLLAGLPKQTTVSVNQGLRELLESAHTYRSSFPITDSKGRRSRPNLAESRQAMTKLAKHLLGAQAILEQMPLSGKQALATAAEAPLGPLGATVSEYALAAKAALVTLKSQPNKAPDNDRAALALQVAVVFRDILKHKPASTRNSINVTGKRHGAAYASVLQTTLQLAGWHNVDLGPLIDRGLRLLRDPGLPHNMPP